MTRPKAPSVGPTPWLLVVPFVSAVASLVAPHVAPSDAVADLAAVCVAVVPALAALALASKARVSPRVEVAVLAASVLGIACVAVLGLSVPLVPLAAGSLVGLGHSIGGFIGRRVADPGHVLPAAAVAAAADLGSVLHPAGPSHLALSSERALSVLALSAPVPGTDAFTFVLGVGDLVFMALLLGVAARHSISTARVAAVAAFGLAASFAASAALGRAVPALVAIGACAVMGVPEFRRVARADRRTAVIAVAAATGVVIALLWRR